MYMGISHAGPMAGNYKFPECLDIHKAIKKIIGLFMLRTYVFSKTNRYLIIFYNQKYESYVSWFC